MERFFAPVATALPEAKQVLVLAPHADDEVFGCGGLLALLAEQGAIIRVLVLTQPADAALAAQRCQESQLAAKRLGYPEPQFVDGADGALAETALDTLVARLQQALANWPPAGAPVDLLLAPSPWEMHRDHRQVSELAIRLCQGRFTDAAPALRLAFYEVGQPLTPNLLVDISAVADRKAEAMECFASQLAHQNYSRQVGALNVYRTYSLPEEVAAVEAFLQIPAAELEAWQAGLRPERLSAVVWQAEREVAAFQAEQVRLNEELGRLGQENSRLGQENVRLSQENSELVQARAHIVQLQADYQMLLSSHSWRITRPFRVLRRLLSQPRLLLRTAMQRMPWAHRRLGALIRRIEHRLQTLMVSRNHQQCQQAMLERRLRPNGLPAGGWGAVCRFTAASRDWPEVTISVVTYNSARWLPALLASLLAQRYPLHRLSLVFVDNGSIDDTLAQLQAFQTQARERFRALELLQLPNPGFGAAHNQAARLAQGPFLLVTNPDLELEPDCLTRVVAMALADDEDVASWELRQAPYEHPKHYDPVSWETLWSSHACILIRRSAFEALGGYDERIFLYGEDVEFSFRCREAGYRLRYCPLALVQHHTYSQANALKPAQYLGSLSANLFLRLRYGGRRELMAAGLIALAGLLRGPFPGARRQLLRAYGQLLPRAPKLLRENRLQARRAVGVFRGFDYALARTGAFEAAANLPDAAAAPLISVITRTYRGRDWLLRQAGLAVMQQTWPNLEWVVVEDGGETCRDSSAAIAAAAPFPVRFFSQPKRGRSAAGNLGLAQARGRWCLFLDDDDLLYADHLETLAAALQAEPELAAAYALAWDVPCDLDVSQQSITEYTYVLHAAHVQAFDRDELAWRNFIPIQAILFERRLFEVYGGFHEHFDQLEDWNLWRRYAQNERFALVPKTTSLFRTPAHPDNSHERQALLDAAYQQVKAETDAELAGASPAVIEPMSGLH